MKVLVLGASGMLGASLLPWLAGRGHDVAGQGRQSVGGMIAADLSLRADADRLMNTVRPQVVINLVSLTDVDRCEAYPQEAWLGNVRTVEHVAAAVKATGAHLVHISTDQVYGADHDSHEDEARPGNYYALSKYAGELAALSAQACVLRTNFFGRSRHLARRSLTDWLYASLTQDRAITVFEDVRFSPLSIGTLCGMIEIMAQRRISGIYNLGSRSGMSKADFAFAFAKALGLPSSFMSRGRASEAPFLKAWRPSAMCMDSSRIERATGLVLPALQQEIERAAKDYLEQT